jgi:hypothetical protein
MSVVSNRVSKIDLGQGLVASDSWMPTVSRAYATPHPAALLPGLSAVLPTMSPKIIPCISRAISAQDEADGLPTVAFQRGKSRESGLFGSSLFPVFVLGAARRSCCTLLLHKVRCSNSCLGGVR